MTTQNFNTLKNLLISSEEFSDIFDFFFQNFAENTSFYERGDLSINETFITIIKTLGKKIHGEECTLSDYRMTEISEENFIHGTCFLNGQIVLSIFFTDINVGLSSISMGGAQFNFVRLKTHEIPKGYGIQFSKEEDFTVN